MASLKDNILSSNVINEIFGNGVEYSETSSSVSVINDNALDFNSKNSFQTQAAAHMRQSLYYDVMQAVEGVNQVAKRVKVLEDKIEAEPVGQCDLSIGTVEEYISFANSVDTGNTYEGKVVQLCRNLDFEDVKNVPMVGQCFTTIANILECGFCGTFEGNNNCLLNMNIEYTDADFDADTAKKTHPSKPVLGAIGIFRTAAKGKIQNLNVINATVVNKTKDRKAVYTGGLLGYASQGLTVQKCSYSGNVKCQAQSGGLIGYAQDSVLIDRCKFTGHIYGSDTNKNVGHRVIGGLVGQTMDYVGESRQVKIIDCKINGIVQTKTSAATAPVIGSILGSTSANAKSAYYVQLSGNYCNMLIVHNNNTIGYTPVLGCYDALDDSRYAVVSTMISANTLNDEIYPDEKYYYYTSSGEKTDYVI